MGTRDTAPANTLLRGVSCNSGTSCTAVGTDGSTTGVAEHWDGTSWTRIPAPLPHGTTRSVTLAAVSCVAAGNCTAVGDWGSPARPLAEHE